MSEEAFNHNLGSIFDPIVSIDAWRTSCNAEDAGAVHVDLTFLEALLGSEPESPVRFRAALKRAVLKVYVSSRDPIKVVRSSVDRGDLTITEHKHSQKITNKSAGSASIAAQTARLPINAKSELSGSFARETSDLFEKKQKLREFDITQFNESDLYCWEIVPRGGELLLGKIWDAVNEPRLHTILTNAKARSSDCEVRLIIECRRQDIEVRDVQLKDKKLSLPAFRGSANNIRAAEAVIRDLLFKKGFSVDNFSEPFSSVTITSVSVAEE